MLARGDLISIDDSTIGAVRQQAPFPRFVGEPRVVPTSAPRLGEHNDEVWCGLVGLSPTELDAHREAGVI
jgi:crotonobetainyl-CoA:carnitine CoA-transferase CaiB-like acyl-CoA transferase